MMSKRSKRLERIRQNTNSVNLADFRRILEDYGFVFRRSEGSHHTFDVVIRGKRRILTVPFRKPIKPVYVKRALQWIDEIIAEKGEDKDDE
jgi:predicted RNA binding protein YcfA (HicA-like mRNA interferase family)